MLEIGPEDFDALVDQALALIPEELMAQIENCFLDIEDQPSAEEGEVLGYYDGIPLSERDSSYFGVASDRIVIFRRPLMEICDSYDELVEEIRITVLHEIGHYFGIDEERLHELGYA